MAVALARAARRSEDRGHCLAAHAQAKQLEMLAWWVLCELTRDLETLEASTSAKGEDERRHRDYAVAMLSVLFLLIQVARGIQQRCPECKPRRDTREVFADVKHTRRAPIYTVPILDPG